MKFKLFPETIFLTVNILDRYLEKTPINRSRLQLLGVSAMLVASKYEDIYTPDVHDFVYITDSAYTRDDVLTMETSILKVLKFNICTPSSYRFLERYCKIIGTEDKQFCLCRYFIELALVEYKMLRYKQSLIAAAGVYLMHKVFHIMPEWPDSLEKNSPYTVNDLKPCAKDMCILFQRANKVELQSIRKKFLKPEFCNVASLTLI